MSEFQATTDAAFKCNTCKSCFTSFDKIKDHYRTDWHVLNSKRRSNNLLPLKRDEFKALVLQANNSNLSGLKTSISKNTTEYVDNTKSAVIVTKELNENQMQEHQNNDKIEDNKEDKEGEEEEGDWEDVDEDGNTIIEAKTNANISIFDDKEFDTVEECVKYMSLTYGFFIPDTEYLVDLNGLLVYLNEKVKLGGYCLYCHKQCIPGIRIPCQNLVLLIFFTL